MHTKVKAILHTFAVSVIPNAPHYHKLLHTSPTKSAQYFMTIMVFLISIFTIGVYFFVIPISRTTHVRTTVIEALKSIPSELQVRIEGGQLSTNLNRPLYIWSTHQEKSPSLLFTVDEQRVSGPYQDSDALVTFAKDHFSFHIHNIIYVKPYDMQTYIINAESMSRFLRLLDMYTPQILTAFYLLYIILFPLLTALWVSVIVFITSLCTYTLFHFFIKRVHLIRCLQATMHGSIIPFILSFLLFVLFPEQISSVIITPFLVGIFSLVSVFEMYFDDLKSA